MYKILLIEDDPDFSQILSECLQSDPDFFVEDVITNQAAAMHRLGAGALNQTDAVIVDLQLPKSCDDKTKNPVAGVELIEEMRLRSNYCGRVIVVTNSNSLLDGRRALNAGCDAYLCKHVRMSEFPRLISELRMAIRDDAMLLSSEMRYLFISNSHYSNSLRPAK